MLETGTFTGYSTLCMARALPAGGRVVTCDISEEWTDTARRFWHGAEVEGRIDLRLGDARELVRGFEADSFDMAMLPMADGVALALKR
ncbi:O-methyltransferase [Kitasatospora sp. NPDC057692]|uniref:O-methyltransferase n=1 Tax=Kitasatospora sp. NPDC057692 TaxID=3346215 RepID=UPI0036A7E79E